MDWQIVRWSVACGVPATIAGAFATRWIGGTPLVIASEGIVAAIGVPGTIVHALLGHIDWGVVVVFGLTSIPLSYVGGRVAVRTHAPKLERLYGAGLLAIGLVTLAVTA